jgi:hypothetical protein
MTPARRARPCSDTIYSRRAVYHHDCLDHSAVTDPPRGVYQIAVNGFSLFSGLTPSASYTVRLHFCV